MGLIADAGFYYIGLLRCGRRVKCVTGGGGDGDRIGWNSGVCPVGIVGELFCVSRTIWLIELCGIPTAASLFRI